jgi:energy-coupling factor transporter transmembrane protein EcfT
LVASIVVGPKKSMRTLAIAVVIGCFLSTALAHSRAGLAFSLIGSLFVLIISATAGAKLRRKQIFFSSLGVVVLGILLLAMAAKNDVRWRNMTSELVAGFHGNAIQLQCEGTAAIESEIASNDGDQSRRLISSLQYGDGSRIVVLRAGIDLAFEHPLGSDGSRQAFQKLLRQVCANPVISMAHTHNGWLDTVLALGWIGGLLYLWVLGFFIKQGLSHRHHESGLNEWAIVLVALSAFWILRGFTDSVFRDHMLEMQGFVLAFAFVAYRSQIKPH